MAGNQNSGGPRPGSGRKKKPLADKITEGKAGGKKLSVIEFSNAANLEGQEMPKPSAMLSATQKDGKTLEAAEIYERTWQWLNERGCSALVLEWYHKSTVPKHKESGKIRAK